MDYPKIKVAKKLVKDTQRVFIGAYGFEARSLGWVGLQRGNEILNQALVFRYKKPKGRNLVRELRCYLSDLGVRQRNEIQYETHYPYEIENNLEAALPELVCSADELVVDISAMTKLLILVCLCKLTNFKGTLRLVYSEAEDYAPTKLEYEQSKSNMELIAKFPSRGFESITRLKCLSSVRMQGQPVSLVAFTSFNEQLVRHMLGSITPHRLFFINGRPPRSDYAWREWATQEIHSKLIEEFRVDNPTDKKGHLVGVSSTLHFKETIDRINEIYSDYGTYERIICAATGSKMQTVGLFFAKMMHPDIHIEYPTPDSYYVKGLSTGVRRIYEIVIPNFSYFVSEVLSNEVAANANV